MHLRSQKLSLDQPNIMGILNITPDSFSDGGHYLNDKEAIKRAMQIQEEGAHLIDIGGESTRPGAQPLSWREEWKRIKKVLKILTKELEIPVSVDTYKTEVASEALEFGVEMINDISLASSDTLLQCVAESEAGYVLMHSRATPQNMMQHTHYSDVVSEVKKEIETALKKVLAFKINPIKICLDLGFGFAKSSEQNYKLFQSISEFTQMNFAWIIGLSRKSMLKEIVGQDQESLKLATIFANLLAYQKGARIFRVHDVKAHVEAFKVLEKLTEK